MLWTSGAGANYREYVDPPAPSPEMVTAARRHLTERYASGVERLLWDTEKRLLPDLAAIEAATDAAAAGQADALDLGAALVLVQAARLRLDSLEYDVFEAAHAAGIRREAIAAILELPDAAAVDDRERWLDRRRALPHAAAEPLRPSEPGGLAEAAARAGHRATRAASRAAEAARRRQQLSQPGPAGPGACRDEAERATARAGEARLFADEAADRVALGLLRAADALDRCAVHCEDGTSDVDDDTRRELRRKAEEYHKAAVRYRDMAARYRTIGKPAR